ncbi:unnamed protein product, partial [Gadus morhua 'NCC']
DIAEPTPESRRIGSCQGGTTVAISEPDPGLSEEPEDTFLDRRERKRRFGDRAKKKAKFRRRGSCQKVTMVTISEPDPGLSEEPEDTSLDREETRKRRFALCLPITLIVSLGLLIILTISLRLSSVMPTEEEEEAPSITEFHSSTHVLPVGQTARYTCHAGGMPEPTVEWLHNGRPLERDGTDDQSEAWVERGFLFVRGGRYGVNTVCCMASNSAGTANHTAELLVFDACELTLDPNTAHRELSLSEDNRKVTWVREDQSVQAVEGVFVLTLLGVFCGRDKRSTLMCDRNPREGTVVRGEALLVLDFEKKLVPAPQFVITVLV